MSRPHVLQNACTLVHALSFLEDLADLLSMAQTCTEARAIVIAHWATALRPNFSGHFRKVFLANLADVTKSLSMETSADLRLAALVERIPLCAADPQSVVRTVPMMHGRTSICVPLTMGRVLQSLRVVGLAGRSPEIKVSFGGLPLITIGSGMAQLLFVASADELELMQFLKHCPAMIIQRDMTVEIKADDAAISVVFTEGLRDPEQLLREFRLQNGINGDRYEWRVEEIKSRREVVPHGSDSHMFRHLPTSIVLEYITVHYSAAATAARVKTFTLLIDGLSFLWAPLTVAGWVCAANKSTSDSSSGAVALYKIPIERQMSFLRLETPELEIVFDRPLSADLDVHVGIMSSNIVSQYCGMIDVAFATSG